MTEAKILEEKIASLEEVNAIKAVIKAEVAAAIKFAEESNYPDPSTLYEDNYMQKDYPFIT